MLHTDMPSEPELLAFKAVRGSTCVSLHMPTMPVTRSCRTADQSLRPSSSAYHRLDLMPLTSKDIGYPPALVRPKERPHPAQHDSVESRKAGRDPCNSSKVRLTR